MPRMQQNVNHTHTDALKSGYPPWVLCLVPFVMRRRTFFILSNQDSLWVPIVSAFWGSNVHRRTHTHACIHTQHTHLHVYTYTCIHTQHTHTYTCIHTQHTHTYTCIHTQHTPTCIHIHMHTYTTHTHTHAYIHNTHTHTHAYIHNTHLHVYTYTCIHTQHTPTCIHIHMHTYTTHTYMYTHTHAYICNTHTYVCIHTHTYTWLASLGTHMAIVKNPWLTKLQLNPPISGDHWHDPCEVKYIVNCIQYTHTFPPSLPSLALLPSLPSPLAIPYQLRPV